MQYIVVSDIFGKTPELEGFAESVSYKGGFQIVSPYKKENLQFSNELEAYSYFSENVGIDVYFKQLCSYILSINIPFRLIGFSVGASVCWKYIANTTNENLIKTDLFYGSQIRNFINLEPLTPVNLIMPKSELHFSIDSLIQRLQNKQNVSIDTTQYFHGFMNELSENYCERAYQQYVTILSSDIS